MIKLSTKIEEVPRANARFLPKLKRLKIDTAQDLLWHFPTRYEDFSKIYSIAELEPHQEATVQGTVREVGGRRTWRRGLLMVEAIIGDETGTIRAVWFNQPYIRNVLQPGRLANFSGKVVLSGDDVYLSNPAYEVVSDAYAETKHTGRIVPVYPETKGLTSKGLRYLIKSVLDDLEAVDETIPEKILRKEELPEINTALQSIHFPTELDEALLAKKRFAFEDLLLLQIHNIKERMKLAQKKAPVIKAETKAVKKIVDGLPFELTPSQKQSLWEVLQSLEKGQPMNRLLQGDVGSGKTIIVAIAALMAAQEGHQVAFMAPTEILARQHYETLTKVFPDFEDGVALLTSNEAKVFYGQGLEQETKKPSLVKDIESEKIKVVIGTHALIQKGVTFPNLSLIVVDEQHRFGVEQRAALIQDSEKKKGSCVPHFLSMSATPIPRTLSLTLFGDLDLSLITELPKNRKPIITKVVAPVNREKAYAFIRGQVKKGRQVFVICPRIEPSTEEAPTASLWSRLEVKSVKEEFEKLSEKVFPDLQVAMLHGKLKAKEKEEVMKDFGEGRCNILVSTSVVEVGVDVPNATIMMIEGAERFGLAQLYQFRGRVGRGEHQSFCFLFTGSSSKTTHQRLKSIVEAKNGLELAEQDLKIRGPGQFLGRAQTGMPDLAMKAIRNPELVKSARESAEVILASDKQLKKHPLLQGRLEFFQKQVHWE